MESPIPSTSIDNQSSYDLQTEQGELGSVGGRPGTSWRQAPGAILLLVRYWMRVVPAVARERQRWQQRAQETSDPELRRLALASTSGKNRLHAEGGSLYTTAKPSHRNEIVRFVVAFQAILDYWGALYELCAIREKGDYRSLHGAVVDATDPNASHAGSYFAGQDDDGYLNDLVSECQRCLASLPSFPLVGPEIRAYATSFADVQVLKHDPPEHGESPLVRWAASRRRNGNDLYWWEIAAAAHTSLAIYALLPLAATENASAAELEQLRATYSPWVCALHILLDSFVDQAFDANAGQLNFFVQYDSEKQAEHRLRLMIARGLEGARDLPDSTLHSLAVSGVVALYLSDAEIDGQGNREFAGRLLRIAGPLGRLLVPMFKLRRATAK